MSDRQRELKKEYLTRERQRERSIIPLSDSQLVGLLASLDDSLDDDECDHTYRLTQTWLTSAGIDEGPVIAGFRERSAYCDCEILMNIDQ